MTIALAFDGHPRSLPRVLPPLRPPDVLTPHFSSSLPSPRGATIVSLRCHGEDFQTIETHQRGFEVGSVDGTGESV